MANAISSEAILKATGKDRETWFALLDTWGAPQRPHAEIADYLYKEQGVPPWWCQMVTVEYERARGLRALNQKTDGFAVSVSKVLPYPVEKVFEAWQDVPRRKWLPEDITITKQTENKTIRGKLLDDTRLSIGFYPKRDRVQVALQHEKLRNAAAVEKQRAFWKKAFERLEKYLG
jgi:hypothetical protein